VPGGKGAAAAAYEVDDFEAVAVFELRFGPALSRDDVAVEFDRDAVGLHVEGFDQDCEREETAALRGGEGAFFSIDLQFHHG